MKKKNVFIILKMCNVYKNNLIILTQIEQDQILYLTDNNLNIDNRYLSLYRSGTKQDKICNTINQSFLVMMNNYILNITHNENSLNNKRQDLTLSLEENIEEIKNTKELLNNSLKGIKIYIDNLEKLNYEINLLENLYINLTKIYDSLDDLREDYIKSIDTAECDNNSESWLYKLYQNTIKSSPKIEEKEIPEIIIQEDETQLSDTTPEPIYNNTDEEHQETEPQDSYVLGFLYIVSRKLSNFVISVGNHLRYIFMR